MKKTTISIIAIVLLLSAAGMGLASVLWKSSNVYRQKIVVKYVDPASGEARMLNYSGTGQGAFEMDKSANDFHYIQVESGSAGDGPDRTFIDISFIGGGMATGGKTRVVAAWNPDLPATLRFENGVYMDENDINAASTDFFYSLRDDGACTVTYKMTVAGTLSIWGSKVPARITAQGTARDISAGFGNYTTINRGFAPDASDAAWADDPPDPSDPGGIRKRHRHRKLSDRRLESTQPYRGILH